MVAFLDYLLVDKMCGLEMEKPIKNQIFWGAKNSIEKNLEKFDCNISTYISKYTNGHGL